MSNLRMPTQLQPWEAQYAGKPAHIASALEIMLQGPIGAARFNNEFGRPNLCGYFRTFEQRIDDATGSAWRGYHKPIMLAGGLGNIRPQHIQKQTVPMDAAVIVLGGPAMQIGLGGGAASSQVTGNNKAQLDFASVQRDNAEMQRRCQEVIDTCWAYAADNPILSIHDVGAGGLANAIPELLDASERGGQLNLRHIPNADASMSPLAIWCNEAQERYVLAIDKKALPQFQAIAERERCPFAVLGYATTQRDLIVDDPQFDDRPVDLPLQVLLGETPHMQRQATTHVVTRQVWSHADIDLKHAVERLLELLTVADKTFLITIGDRSVGGLTARDQMVGPWQIPVADCAVTSQSFYGYHGEALAVGERTPSAVLNAAAAARMAVGEAITNIAAAPIAQLSDVKLSANWMVAAGYPGEDAGLYAAVHAVGMELCPALGLAIPVGKDSMSMRMQWQGEKGEHSVTAPLSLIISAAAPVTDVRRALTPQLQTDHGGTELLFMDLANGAQRLGASCIAQVFNELDQAPADVDDPTRLKNFFAALQALNQANLLLAYHDRSDGGLFVTLCEMAFAGHVGIDIYLDDLGEDSFALLFNEELGAVIQIRHTDHEAVYALLKQYELDKLTHAIGTLNARDEITFWRQQQTELTAARVDWQRLWSSTSYHMQALRDNPHCAKQAYAAITEKLIPDLQPHVTFDVNEDITAPFVQTARPTVAILREQGVNGQLEMAAAFDRAGFACLDVHMTDIIDRQRDLRDCVGLAVCGGFSYGDVLGAGRGWANTILHHPQARDVLHDFFTRPETFTLAVCNGCQMLTYLTDIIPGSEHWPQFLRNESEQFEARLSLVEVMPTPSVLLQGMVGSRLPIIVSHGEGRAQWSQTQAAQVALDAGIVALRYVDGEGQVAQTYPTNPNGSPYGITGLCSQDGRVTLMMPHPERIFRTVQHSWHPHEWGEDGPWLRLFRNAYCFIKK